MSSNDQDYVILNTPEQKSELTKLVEYAWRRQNSIPKSVNPSFQENFSGQYSSVAQVDESAFVLDGGHGGIQTWQSYLPTERTIIVLGGGTELNTVEASFLEKYKLEYIVRQLMNQTEGMIFYVDGHDKTLVKDRQRKYPNLDDDPFYFKSGPYAAFTVPDDPTLASATTYDKQQVAIYYSEIWALALKFKKEPQQQDHTLRAHHWVGGYELNTTWKIHLVDIDEHLDAYKKNAYKMNQDTNYTKNP
ncbi:MAG TPA: hypothetical protein VKA09_06270 [Nitrososphaeraceae archaeon]|jgi:hypothetical protein|nr:hypothetical protein [Nitrososphaeraceae archaeon]